MRSSSFRSSILLLGAVSVIFAADSQWEEKFRAIPSPQNLRDYMERLSARPHHVGSPYDKDNAEWILAKLKSWGLDAKIENFDVLFPTPQDRFVEMVEPTKFTAKLEEPAVAVDPTSNQKSEQLPVYHAYSIDGDVTAPLVYVNYGIPADYEQLERMGISVSGAIVIARYGASWRGIKPKVAAEHGALACIVYSDPRDDGYYTNDVFPVGPQRPRDGAQRGSVMDMPLYPGDPLTPGVGAVPDAKRLAVSEAKTLTKIPVLPMSYGDAQPLLAALKGPLAPENWRGALPITYHVGPGPARVHVRLKFNWDIKRLYDVIVRIPGAQYPDEWVIRGNHHDGWVNGAEDPVSGAVAEMEEARGLAEMLKQGWKPKRTIIYCFWDGEEPGLLGSTEWAETHAAELQQHAVAYINSDGNGRGFLGASGSHSLENFINGVMKDIQDPEMKTPVWKRSQLVEIQRAPGDKKKEVRTRPDLRISALGSGSDYTAFIDHLGVASMNLGFGGEGGGGGVYHSIYDDFYWYTHFADTDFVYGRALAQTAGTAMIRLADADLLPFQFSDFSDTVRTYIEELKRLDADQREHAEELNRELDEGVFTAAADPRERYIPPSRQPVPPHLNFAPLENAIEVLALSAQRYDAARQKANASNFKAVNAKLIESERRLTDSAGLPGRPWFRHMIYAPGFYTGYGVKTIPGVREAIEQKRWQEADQQIQRVGAILMKEADLLDEAVAVLGK
ncbi:MAG TPA: transferrin receptor-like dimerization domain-containing protein [Bryobacteraceae bacterium]|nr:transferrin receptor-like dimerization domain-containing protein [Bryobacteraceae bacterium]